MAAISTNPNIASDVRDIHLPSVKRKYLIGGIIAIAIILVVASYYIINLLTTCNTTGMYMIIHNNTILFNSTYRLTPYNFTKQVSKSYYLPYFTCKVGGGQKVELLNGTSVQTAGSLTITLYYNGSSNFTDYIYPLGHLNPTR